MSEPDRADPHDGLLTERLSRLAGCARDLLDAAALLLAVLDEPDPAKTETGKGSEA